jgi:hypothetical protein
MTIDELTNEANKVSQQADEAQDARNHPLAIALNKRALSLYTEIERLSIEAEENEPVNPFAGTIRYKHRHRGW